MKSTSVSFLCISAVFALTTLSKLVSAGKCNTEPQSQFKEANAKCEDKLGEETSAQCVQICTLKNFGVITNDAVEDSKWSEWVSLQWPKEYTNQITAKLKTSCSKLYESTQLNLQCDENDEFYRCIEDTVDEICEN